MSQKRAVLLLGSNLGDTKKNIEEAIFLLNERVGKVLEQSDFLFSDPVEFVSSNIFCNIALCIWTELSPIQLLKVVKDIEKQMGRLQDSAIYGEYQDRVIDIDIVYFEGIYFECKTLSIPHQKHTKERDFSIKLLEDLNKRKIK